MNPSSHIRHAWERWRPAWQVLFIALNLISLAAVAGETGITHNNILAAALLTGGLLAWYGWGEMRAKHGWVERLWPVTSYFVLGWLLWFGAAFINTPYFLLLFVLFPHVFMVVRLAWAIVLAALLNMLVLLALHHINSDYTATWMLLIAVTSVSGSVLALFISNVIRQSSERQHLIGELEAVNEKLAKTRYEAGILYERQRLAGELHDTIIQGLVAVITHLEASDNTTDINQINAHILRAKTIARENLQEARRFIWAMQPDILENQAMEDRLKSFLENWSSGNGLQSTMILTGKTQPVPLETAHTLLRVAQESLANVQKHADATHVTLTLSYMPDTLVMDVNDDGKGFDTTAPLSGFGLGNMRRRVVGAGGTLTVESQLSEGTTIVAEIPLNTKIHTT